MTFNDVVTTLDAYEMEGTPVVRWRLTEADIEALRASLSIADAGKITRPYHNVYICEIPVTVLPPDRHSMVVVRYGQGLFALGVTRPLVYASRLPDRLRS